MTGPQYVIRPSSMFLFVNNFDDRAHERLEVVRRYRKRRREIDDIADRPHEYAQFDKPTADRIEIDDLIKLTDTDARTEIAYLIHPPAPEAAQDANARDAFQAAARLETSGEHRGNVRYLPQARLL